MVDILDVLTAQKVVTEFLSAKDSNPI